MIGAYPLFNSREAGEFIGVRAQQVQRWARSGRLQGYRAGRLWRFSKSQLLQFLGEGKNDNSDPIVARVNRVSVTPEPLDEDSEARQVKLMAQLNKQFERYR